MTTSIINTGDSYKYGHAFQYPTNMTSMYDYMESRGGVYPATIFAGLQYYLKRYLQVPTTDEVIKAATRAAAHGVPFDKEGWLHIVSLGHIPVTIKAVPEGMLIPTHYPLVTIESTDPKVPWIAGYLETLLMKVWYPTNIATKSYYVKQMLQKYGSPEWAQFAYHNFGDRGSSSVESAAIGGFAHMTQFMGTDNFNALALAEEYYDAGISAAYSVFATEHSTTTSRGADGEEQFVWEQLQANPDAPIVSFVADSYDVYKFTDTVTNPEGRIRQLLESRPHQKFVIRPDSGEPIEVLSGIIMHMKENGCFDADIDGKLLSTKFGILWGDGITPATIENILQWFTAHDSPNRPLLAAENFVFGSGGDLMQNHTRDTQRFAVKCSEITVADTDIEDILGGQEAIYTRIPVFKDPITDPGKKSKKGKVTTYYDTEAKTFRVAQVGDIQTVHEIALLGLVYRNGKHYETSSLSEIRDRA